MTPLAPSLEGRATPHGAEPRQFLQPGELWVSREPVELVTILGSCVAVCVWAPAARAGGMNHFLLPSGSEGRPSPLRFGDAAVPRLIDELGALGFAPSELEAKVFGGAAVLRAPGAGQLGERNVRMALDQLARLRVRVVARDTGGDCGRKLRFTTVDGAALVKRLGGPR